MMHTGENVVDGKYKILRLLGQGGMGAVYEAEHRGTGRRVALKVIVSEALAKENDILVRFQREARASGSIDSQHVVQVLDTGVDPATGSPYMVMELLSGDEVQALGKQLGPLPPDLVLRIIAQACLGLQRAHEKGVIHRDIKSANMFLSRREGGERVLKLLDFGIAKVRADQLSASDNHGLTRTGSMLGSPLYMSPEQARGKKTLDGRSDLFSLGVVMYEALTGTQPNGHCETLGDLILAICSERTEPVQNRAAWVPPEIAAIVHKALAQDPAHRFESAAAMHAAIAAFLPHGGAIHESMFVGLSPAMRAYVAPRFEPIPPAASSVPSLSHLASTGVAPVTGSGPFGPVTTVGAGRSAAVTDVTPPPPKPASPARWIVPIAAVVVLGGVTAAGFVFGPLRSKAAAIRPTEATSATAASTTPAETPSATTAPAPRTIYVSIGAPADAKVEVDGRAVEVKDGKVEVRGTVGSVHPVRVSAGGRETRADVTIDETGPIPRVELVVPKVTGGGGGGGGTRPAAPPVPAAGVAAAAGAAPPVAKPSESAKQPAGAPTINRNF